MSHGPPDALDPGPDGDYPYWPRNPDGTTDRQRMPSTPYLQGGVLVDPAPGNPDGTPAGPPDQNIPTSERTTTA